MSLHPFLPTQPGVGYPSPFPFDRTLLPILTMRRAEALNERGNRYFVAKKYSAACSSFTEGLTALGKFTILSLPPSLPPPFLFL